MTEVERENEEKPKKLLVVDLDRSSTISQLICRDDKKSTA